jgi:1,4-alpha-glucan branching enzyme
MRLMGSSGIWELFVPGIQRGDLYKYELKLADGNLRIKTDPLAFAMELRPKSAAVVWGLGDYRWGDARWMEDRKSFDHRRQPMAIYEVHLGSWMRGTEEGDRWLSFSELAPRLVDHAKAHGFTHIELMPVAEHAFDPSWGYQTTGHFAVTSRYGTPEDFRCLVDLCHQNGIGVILDWVPGHFPKDDYSLRWFDGTALYEHADPRQGEHRDWGTLIFNYGRNEVRAYLLANAVYWLDQFHLDALRVDAVASMIYLDYSRNEGEWVPNRYGGRENLDAITFLQELNAVVYDKFPGAFTVAEESTAWGGVTAPTYLGGLGFGFKWNMGWMHDTLSYFSKDPVHRTYHHRDLTFGMLYEYTENFILPLSHDEVVHMKGSLWGKMPGDPWQKAANLRLLLTYLYTRPGKKLLFMGGEFGQAREWNADFSLDWHQVAEPLHAGVQQLSKDIGSMYLAHDALWAWDVDPKGFSWIDCSDNAQSVISYLRHGPGGHLACVFNFTPVPRYDYRIGLPEEGVYLEHLNTDAAAYGGSNVGNGGQVIAERVPWHGLACSACLTLPPLGALVLRPQAAEKSSAEKVKVGSRKTWALVALLGGMALLGALTGLLLEGLWDVQSDVQSDDLEAVFKARSPGRIDRTRKRKKRNWQEEFRKLKIVEVIPDEQDEEKGPSLSTEEIIREAESTMAQSRGLTLAPLFLSQPMSALPGLSPLRIPGRPGSKIKSWMPGVPGGRLAPPMPQPRQPQIPRP